MFEPDNEFIKYILHAHSTLMLKVMSDFKPEGKGKKINKTQWKTLHIIYHEGSPTMSQICRRLNLEKGSLTSVVDGLIDHHFVERIPDENDRRKTRLILTGKGEKVIEKGIDMIRNHIGNKLQHLTQTELDQLFEALKTVFHLSQKI